MFSGTWALDVRRGGLDINPDRLRELEQELVASGQNRGAERRAQAREQSTQGRVLRARRLVGPQGSDQLVTAHGSVPVEHEIGEQQRHLLASQRAGPLNAAELDRQATAELDAGPFTDAR
jgi:hypothetical protein